MVTLIKIMKTPINATTNTELNEMRAFVLDGWAVGGELF
ncbi:hypothetical protein GPLA_2982 [Paraglaciecola polaris LMG 21857]|uniref:Uncharacterized protein n=1 Tax=Paraglaciecola polaris LMG 21857 TaxID=1129793 RepID=K7AF05_9ALTE|nr:hypothetical protein GPLA_2982 [Paraglaciecola polaris LMG 21857]